MRQKFNLGLFAVFALMAFAVSAAALDSNKTQPQAGASVEATDSIIAMPAKEPVMAPIADFEKYTHDMPNSDYYVEGGQDIVGFQNNGPATPIRKIHTVWHGNGYAQFAENNGFRLTDKGFETPDLKATFTQVSETSKTSDGYQTVIEGTWHGMKGYFDFTGNLPECFYGINSDKVSC